MWVLVETITPNRRIRHVNDDSGDGGIVHPSIFGRHLPPKQQGVTMEIMILLIAAMAFNAIYAIGLAIDGNPQWIEAGAIAVGLLFLTTMVWVERESDRKLYGK